MINSVAENDLMARLNQAIDNVIVNARTPGKRTDPDGRPICFYCARPLTDKNQAIDHITPTSLGGVDLAFNKVICCSHCNVSKNGRHPVYWLMLQQMSLTDEDLLNWLGRVLYHYLTTTQEPEPAFELFNLAVTK